MRAALILATVFSASLAFGAGDDVQTFKIDPAHTSAVFKVSHMGFAPVFGIITGADGKFTYDDKKPENSSFDISLKVDSLTTMDKKRDDHLKSPDFFNAKQNPMITMKSTKVKKKKGDEYDVTADLTLNGVTKPVTFVYKRNKTGKDPWGNTRAGGEAMFKIKRSDFNMTFMGKPGEVGDDVFLEIGVEGTKQ
jgi:polyisoprenoid-binding protein YceI